MVEEKYIISLWDDELVTEDLGDGLVAYFKERVIGTIGSNTMTAMCRACEPQMVSNVNGTNKFTFKMYYTCRNDTYEDLVRQFLVQPDNLPFEVQQELLFLLRSVEFTQGTYTNPFLSLLVNERKLKVFWKDKWYDLIIKNCQEDSVNKCIVYTCTDVYINELSKTGFDIELDAQLENNTGTVTELAQIVLNNTDWTVDVDGSDLLQQMREEAVYETIALSSFMAHNDEDDEDIAVPAGAKVLTYWNPISDIVTSAKNRDGGYYLQFAYTNNYEVAQEEDFNHNQFKPGLTYFEYHAEASDYKFQQTQDSSRSLGKTYYLQVYECEKGGQVVTNAPCCSVDNTIWTKECSTIPSDDAPDYTIHFWDFWNWPSDDKLFDVTPSDSLSTQYRANRLIRSQRTAYDPLTNKYCKVFEATASNSAFDGLVDIGDTIYKYEEIQYRDPTTVNNLVVNNKDFISVEGWLGKDLTFQLDGVLSATTPTVYPKSCLHLTAGQNVCNTGLRQLSNYIPNGIAYGDMYVFRYKIRSDINDAPSTSYILDTKIEPHIASYTTDSEGAITYSSDYFPLPLSITHIEDDWVEYIMACRRSFSRADVYNDNIGIVLTVDSGSDIWLEQAEFFPLVYGEGDPAPRINPGEMNITSVAATYHCYYNHTKSQNLINPEDITYLYKEAEDIDPRDSLFNILTPIYNENFEKVLTVSAKQSNRYNLLQKIAETFECYIEFNIEHNFNTGQIIYVDGVPQKSVRFKAQNGQKTGIGFIYGIDLKSIQRTIQSDQIVTKMIVSPNKNEFAQDGFCTIARSHENPSHSNFILNFDYYISQGLLKEDDVKGYLSRYYLFLGWLTSAYNEQVEREASLRMVYLKQKSYVTLYESAVNSLEEQILVLRSEVMSLTGTSSWNEVLTWLDDHPDPGDSVNSRIVAISSLEHSKVGYSESLEGLQVSITNMETAIAEAVESQNRILNNMQNLHLWFYRLFSRFIQEGTWIDESYMDDDLYYLEALKNARISSRPQVSYTISVIRVSALEEFKHKVFKLGDITYIQDPEFFGYTMVDGIKTPYKEVVLLSEITSNFDEPDKDTFKVQNYKTEFEDLFQRINSTSQDFHFGVGGFNRINSLTESNGTIKAKVLQDSINQSNLTYSTPNKQLFQGTNELIVSDIVNINKKTKITPGGIFVTENGGETWKNAVNAAGLQQQAMAKNGNVNVSTDGVKIDTVSGTRGISYGDNANITGDFDVINAGNLRIDDDEIQYSGFGGRIEFSLNDLILYGKNRGAAFLTIQNSDIDLRVDNHGIITFSGGGGRNDPSLAFNLRNGKLTYSWYDSTTSSMISSVLNLKTFTPN